MFSSCRAAANRVKYHLSRLVCWRKLLTRWIFHLGKSRIFLFLYLRIKGFSLRPGRLPRVKIEGTADQAFCPASGSLPE